VMGHDRTFAALAADVKNPANLGPPVAGAAADAAAGAAAVAAGGADAAEPGAAAAESSAPPPAPAAAPAAAAPARHISVLKLARPGGVSERSRESRREARAARVRAYFYGPVHAPGGGAPPPPFSPETLVLRFDQVSIVRVGGAATDAALVPMGKRSALEPLRVTPVQPTAAALLNQLLGVSAAATDRAVPHVNVAGFVHVRAVNVKEKTITVLAPCAGALPGRFLILGANSWAETS
jgi:hypothetical protein